MRIICILLFCDKNYFAIELILYVHALRLRANRSLVLMEMKRNFSPHFYSRKLKFYFDNFCYHKFKTRFLKTS